MMMKLEQRSYICLDELIAKATDIKNHSRDLILEDGLLSAEFVNVGRDGKLTFLMPLQGDEKENRYMFRVGADLTHWSLGQLCTIAGIPRLYVSSLMDSGFPDVKNLAAENLNTLFKHVKKPILLRLYQPKDEGLSIRGILSPRYSSFDSDDVLKTLKDVMEDRFDIKGYQLDETGMHLRIVTPEPLNIDGEDLYPGCIISSGDVGNACLTVTFFIWKQVCTNGLVMEKLSGRMLHKRHLGIYSRMDFRKSLVEVMDDFPVFCENAKELIESAREIKMDADELKTRIDLFNKSVKLSENETEEIQVLTMHYGLTLWGFVNALTEFAQKDRFDLEDRLGIETYAGDLVTSTNFR